MKIWFQNRRTKWKKQENITNEEAAEHKIGGKKYDKNYLISRNNKSAFENLNQFQNYQKFHENFHNLTYDDKDIDYDDNTSEQYSFNDDGENSNVNIKMNNKECEELYYEQKLESNTVKNDDNKVGRDLDETFEVSSEENSDEKS